VKIFAQEDSTGRLVGLELGDGHPKLSRRLIFGHGEVKNRFGDGAVEPHAHAAVHLFPRGIIAARRNEAVDVMKKPELATHRLEERQPLVVVGVREIQRHGDVRFEAHHGVGVKDEGAGRWIQRGGHGGGASRHGCGGEGGHDCRCNLKSVWCIGGATRKKRRRQVVWRRPRVGRIEVEEWRRWGDP